MKIDASKSKKSGLVYMLPGALLDDFAAYYSVLYSYDRESISGLKISSSRAKWSATKLWGGATIKITGNKLSEVPFRPEEYESLSYISYKSLSSIRILGHANSNDGSSLKADNVVFNGLRLKPESPHNRPWLGEMRPFQKPISKSSLSSKRDIFKLSKFKDEINSGSGDDLIIQHKRDRGVDEVTGGKGADIFKISNKASGYLEIKDFDPRARDRIDVKGKRKKYAWEVVKNASHPWASRGSSALGHYLMDQKTKSVLAHLRYDDDLMGFSKSTFDSWLI